MTDVINPFSTSVGLLYPLKTSKNLRSSDVFRGYRSGTLVENQLILPKMKYEMKHKGKIAINVSSYANSRNRTSSKSIDIDSTGEGLSEEPNSNSNREINAINQNSENKLLVISNNDGINGRVS